MIDWQQFEAFRSDVGAEDCDAVLEVFLAELQEGCAALRQPSAATDLQARFHALKGSAVYLGFSAMAAACSEAERKAAGGHCAASDIAKVESLYESSMAALQQRR